MRRLKPASFLPFLAAISAFPSTARAEQENRVTPEPVLPHGAFLEAPLVDLPFTIGHGGAFPSMEQSLWITTDFYQAIHFGIGAWLDPPTDHGRASHPVLARLLVGALDILTVAVPPALAWQHEEWHRAVLSRYGIGSYDGVYHMDIFSDLISVDHVRDEDLVWLKATHPADQVRLSTAGIEGNVQLAVNMERVGFFHDTNTSDVFLLWLIAAINTNYMVECATTASDSATAKANAADGTSITKRDITGLDCDGWTYDLFRPDEPYASRGVHPSGVGIDRYRSYSQLLPLEQHYVRMQAWLSLLNFVDPNLLGIRRFTIRSPFSPGPLAFNLALRHLPTAFGYDVRLDLLAQQARVNLAISLHAYFNEEHFFPGLEAEVIRYPFGSFLLSSRLAGWMQPEDLRFGAASGRLGGLASIRATLARWSALQPYLEIEAKSAGWVAGNVYLDRNFATRLGLSARLL
jgi:hypothetical protein